MPPRSRARLWPEPGLRLFEAALSFRRCLRGPRNYWDCGVPCDGDCDDRKGGPTVRTACLPLSPAAELAAAVVAGFAIAGAAAELFTAAFGVCAPRLAAGLRGASALA